MVELNTLLGLPSDFNPTTLVVGKHYTITKDRERAFPLHLAVLIVDKDWNFYGYAVVHSAVIKDQQTELNFEVLSLFTPEDQQIYQRNFVHAARQTGEVK